MAAGSFSASAVAALGHGTCSAWEWAECHGRPTRYEQTAAEHAWDVFLPHIHQEGVLAGVRQLHLNCDPSMAADKTSCGAGYVTCQIAHGSRLL